MALNYFRKVPQPEVRTKSSHMSGLASEADIRVIELRFSRRAIKGYIGSATQVTFDYFENGLVKRVYIYWVNVFQILGWEFR